MKPDPIAAAGADTQAALLALNNAHAAETSLLTPEKWAHLVDIARVATCIDGAAGFLIAIGHDAAYDNTNFRWFSSRLDDFVYVDRIVIDGAHRGRGLARLLYEDLFERARADDCNVIVCEVNRNPPNPGSDAFHARMGFERMGEAHLPDSGKTVRYLARRLGTN